MGQKRTNGFPPNLFMLSKYIPQRSFSALLYFQLSTLVGRFVERKKGFRGDFVSGSAVARRAWGVIRNIEVSCGRENAISKMLSTSSTRVVGAWDLFGIFWPLLASENPIC